MSEMLKAGERATESLEVSYGLQSLEKEAGKFNPEEALRLREQDLPGERNWSEKREVQDFSKRQQGEQFLQVLPETQEVELSPQEAAEEYLSLLDDLSKDFSNPYYSDERKGDHHYAKNITTDLGRKYSKNPHYRWRGYASTEAGLKDGTMLRIASADNILANEIGWREEGEKNASAIEKNREEMTKLDESYAKKGWLGKLFGKKKYQKARQELSQLENATKIRTRHHNQAIAKELAISYNERGNYDRGSGDYGELENETRNRQFFGFDDPERAAKVERAIELRKKYESEWTKEK